MRRLPFAELIEKAASTARAITDDDAYRQTFGGYVNAAYDQLADDVPYLYEGMRETNRITIDEDYITGSVAVTSGSTTVTGTSTVWTSAMDGYKFKVLDTDEIYTLTYVSATSLTLDKAYKGDTDSGLDYIIWQDRYALTAGVVYDPQFKLWWNNDGIPQYLHHVINDTWAKGDKSVQAGIPDKYRLYDSTSAGLLYLELNKPDDDGRYMYYDCSMVLDHLREYTTGTASATRDQYSVFGTGTRWSAESVAAGWWIRFDDDGTGDNSRWYQIYSVDSNTSIRLATPYLGTTKSAANYTVCNASKLPQALDKAIISLAAAFSVTDTGETAQAKVWFDAYASQLEKVNKKQRPVQSSQLKTIYSKPGVRR